MFRQYFTGDEFNRRIGFYLSEPEAAATDLPLIVFIQGAGCSSHFRGADGKVWKRIPNLLHDVVRNRARVPAVEKPGVDFLDDRDDESMQDSCRPQFFQEHTLERWTAAIAAAVRAARELPFVGDSRTLAVGFSEGALAAIRVSGVVPGVTHAASLSGGGPNHLYVAAEFVRRRGLDPQEQVFDCWQRVRAKSESTVDFCLGHPCRHWSSFYRTSLIEECFQSKAKLYIVHGSEDRQNFISGFDVLRAELTVKGRTAVFERLEGAGHSLDLPGQKTPEGLIAVFGRLADWFLSD